MYRPRVVDRELQDLLSSMGAVVIEGPKACGKTETARQVAASEVRLDVGMNARRAVSIDPSLVLEGAAPRLLDEWQITPELWNHVRRAVDDRRAAGQFILTGSAVPADDVTRHTGAGRLARLRMRPMCSEPRGPERWPFVFWLRTDRFPWVSSELEPRHATNSGPSARWREIKELRAWSPIPEEVAAYAEEMASTLGVPVSGASSPKEAVEGADLVVTVTPSREPLLELGWLAKGATVVAVGADGPGKQELAAEILGAPTKVVVDSRAQCVRLGETQHAVSGGILAPEDIHAELGEVLLGMRPGREGDELIVCDLTGLGAQDAAMAGVVWDLLNE